jgi:hypothetical protein
MPDTLSRDDERCFCAAHERCGHPTDAHIDALTAADTLRRVLERFMTERGEYRGITPEKLSAELRAILGEPHDA